MNNAPPSRLLALDIFRGITIVLMILVNSPGNLTPYPFLAHSYWNGCTLADIVFPFFIFIVGVSSVFVLSNQRKKGFSFIQHAVHICKRTLFLFALGFFLNLLSCYGDLSSVRILGVLQRIAICYGLSSFLFLTTKIRTQAIIIGIILVIYWLLLTQMPAFDSLSGDNFLNNIVGVVDRAVFTSSHLYTALFDPEGILSTLPALASCLMGNLLGYVLRTPHSPQKKLLFMISAGACCLLLGYLINPYFPINKSMWTSTYVLWTTGLALFTFSICYWFIEIMQLSKWTKFFNVFGTNALFAYVLHVVFLKIQIMIHISSSNEEITLKHYITSTLFPTNNLQLASLLYAMTYVGFCYIITSIVADNKNLFKKGYKMKWSNVITNEHAN